MSIANQIKAPGQVKLPGGSGSGGGGGPVAIGDISDWPAGVSATEVGYLDGVTSSIQTQLNGKAASSHSHSAGDMPSGIDAAKIGGGSVSNTEFGYLDGVTSGIQAQLDGKAATSHTHSASDINSGTIATARLGSGTADNTKFLRGDQTWAVPSGGGGGGGILGVVEKTTDYTLLTADKDYMFRMNSASNRSFTVDGSLDLPDGGMIHLSRAGTGEVTIVASGATVNSPGGLRLRAQFSAATLVRVAADVYDLIGDTKV